MLWAVQGEALGQTLHASLGRHSRRASSRPPSSSGRRLLRAISQCADHCSIAITPYSISSHKLPDTGFEGKISEPDSIHPSRRTSASAYDSLPLRRQSSDNTLEYFENSNTHCYKKQRRKHILEDGKMEECSGLAAIAAISRSACSRGSGGKLRQHIHAQTRLAQKLNNTVLEPERLKTTSMLRYVLAQSLGRQCRPFHLDQVHEARRHTRRRGPCGELSSV
jgi:hypothetical protein